MKTNELKRNYKNGNLVSVAAMIKAGFFVETEITKMLTAQMNDKRLTVAELIATKSRIRKSGYVIENTGAMKSLRVFEVTC